MKNGVIHQIEVTPDKEKAAKTILHHIEGTINQASPEQLQNIVESIKPKVIDPEKKALAKKIAGADYSEGNLAVLELVNLERYYQRRRELLERSITTPEVARLIGCQAVTTVHDRRKAKTLLGLKENGVYRFPLWQFDPEGGDGVIDGLPELLKALDISNFTKLSWLTKPLKAFDGKTPVEILKSCDIEDIRDLIVEARGVGVAQ